VFVPIYRVEALDSPCLFGIFSPAIYLTTENTENEAMRRYTIMHELTHLRHADHIWSILRCVCLVLHWYNPLVWWAAILSCRDAELACDEAMIADFSAADRAEYGRTLLAITCTRRTPVHLASSPLAASERSIHDRIVRITKSLKPAHSITILAICLVLIVAAAAFIGANKYPADSIFNEIVIDNTASRHKILKQGMSIDEVLDAMKLTRDDVEIQEGESAITGGYTAHMRTLIPTVYAETSNFGFTKIFIFDENGLSQLNYVHSFTSGDYAENYAAATAFAETFLESANIPAIDFENLTLSYHAYGSIADTYDPGLENYYEYQFLYGGQLGAITLHWQDMRGSPVYIGENDYVLHVTFSLSFSRELK